MFCHDVNNIRAAYFFPCFTFFDLRSKTSRANFYMGFPDGNQI